MNIAICDDDKAFLEVLQADLISLQKDTDKFYIMSYGSGEELLSDYHAGNFDVVILDIEMNKLNGMDTAIGIRKIDKKVIIVFLTNYDSFAVKGYEAGAFRYILKDQPIQVYKQQLDDAIKYAYNLRMNMVLNSRKEMRKISVSDILYIEVLKHTICIHLTDGEDISFTGKLRDIERQLEGLDFAKIDRGRVINTDKIKSISDIQITLEGINKTEVLYASRKYIKDIRLKFMESFKRRFG